MAVLARRLRWVSITPRGVRVDPEVYCSIASVSGERSGGCHPAAVGARALEGQGDGLASPIQLPEGQGFFFSDAGFVNKRALPRVVPRADSKQVNKRGPG